jgi:hypothetical protein
MPLSFGRALINRGAPFPIKQSKLGVPSSQGHSLSYLSGKVERALPTGAHPFLHIRQSWGHPSNRGAPFPICQAKLGGPFQQGCALSYLPGKVGHALPTGARPFLSIRQSWACPSHKGAPFPIYQAVYQELTMDGGIAKPRSA